MTSRNNWSCGPPAGYFQSAPYSPGGPGWGNYPERERAGCSSFPPLAQSPDPQAQAQGYGPPARMMNQPAMQSQGWQAEPDWIWMASWEKFDPYWQSGNEAALWADAWRRMGNQHRFISPAQMTYQQTPNGGVMVTAHWVSASSPRGPSTLPQSLGTYAGWYKRADMWRAGEMEQPQARAPWNWRGPGSPW